jgi:hypothetical protein
MIMNENMNILIFITDHKYADHKYADHKYADHFIAEDYNI